MIALVKIDSLTGSSVLFCFCARFCSFGTSSYWHARKFNYIQFVIENLQNQKRMAKANAMRWKSLRTNQTRARGQEKKCGFSCSIKSQSMEGKKDIIKSSGKFPLFKIHDQSINRIDYTSYFYIDSTKHIHRKAGCSWFNWGVHFKSK